MDLMGLDNNGEGFSRVERNSRGASALRSSARKSARGSGSKNQFLGPRFLRMTLASLLCMAAWGQVSAQTTCNGQLYESIADGNSDNTAFNTIKVDTNPPTFAKLGDKTAANYNALGYNVNDGQFYAMKYNTNNLLRINLDGSTTDLGSVAGLPKDGTAVFTSGAIDANGNYYIKVQDDTSIIYLVDIAAKSAKAINLTTPIAVSDMAFVNGVLYSVGNNGQLYKIAITNTTGAVTPIGKAYDTAAGQQLGAQFGATNGLFGMANDGSGFYYIDVATGIRTKLSDSPKAASNDGANCPTVALDFRTDLAVTKTAGSYVPGSPLVYTITVKNKGPLDVTNAPVIDTLPDGIDPSTASWKCAGTGEATCGSEGKTSGSGAGSINDKIYLPFNETVTYTLTVNVPASFRGELKNTAKVELPADAPYLHDSDLTNNEASVISTQSKTDLSITKTNGATTYLAGSKVTYTIVVANAGPDAVTGATVTDTLPGGVSDVSWTCVKVGDATCHAGQGTLADTINLAAGASATYTLTMTVPAGFKGALTNTASVVPPPGVIDTNANNDTATDTDVQASADLSITKTDGATTYKPGTDVTYTITVTNNGTETVTGAKVRDPLPEGITKASWTCATCKEPVPGALSETVTLNAGASTTYTVVLSVPSTFIGKLANTATVDLPAGMVDATPDNNTATDTNQQAAAAPTGTATPVPVGGGWVLTLLTGLMGLISMGFGTRRRG